MQWIQYSLEVAICWMILYLVFILVVRRETFFHINRTYLLTSIVAGLSIPLLRLIPISVSQHTTDFIEPIQFISSTPQIITRQILPIYTSPSTFSFDYIIWFVYIVGAMICLLRFLYGLRKIYKLYSTGIITRKENYTQVRNKAIRLPFSFCNMLFLSSEEQSYEKYNSIVLHELTHIESRHSYDVILMEILSILFWWNPMVYLYKIEIRKIHEYLADAEVLKSTDKKMYGHILLGQSESGLEIALAHSFFHSHLKDRFHMMYKKKSNWSAKIKYVLILPLFALLSVLFMNNTGADTIISVNEYSAIDLRESLVEIHKAWNPDNPVREQIQPFRNLLRDYQLKFPTIENAIKRDFKSSCADLGIYLEYSENCKISTFMFIVPKEFYEEWKDGLHPGYDQLVYRGMTHTDIYYPNIHKDYKIMLDGAEIDFTNHAISKYAHDFGRIEVFPPNLAKAQFGITGRLGLISIHEMSNPKSKKLEPFILEIGSLTYHTEKERERFIFPLKIGADRIQKLIDDGSGFGMRIHPTLKKKQHHAGIDLNVKSGTEIVAPMGGKVTKASYDNKRGNYLNIDHGDGLVTVYYHLSKSVVREGEVVTPGQLIGLVGSTGMSTVPHLHFEVRENGKAINPKPFLFPK